MRVPSFTRLLRVTGARNLTTSHPIGGPPCEWYTGARAHLAQGFASPLCEVSVSHALGSWLFTRDGNKLLDFTAGIGVVNMPGVFVAPFPCESQNPGLGVAGCLAQDTAAIFIEPVLGEGGYVPAPTAFLQGLRELCDKHSMLPVFDEVRA
ncbi:pyridoxal phosphate-dependent transferase [Pavlovales sp. CCMP2436]|nr:pyridoxal phosphate-dependent transferase [Pavlovales sp. CCMP2436]